MILHVEAHVCLDAAVVVLPLVLVDVEEVAQAIAVVNAMVLAADLVVLDVLEVVLAVHCFLFIGNLLLWRKKIL